MKEIFTNGIAHLEAFEGCREWRWGTDYACGDLYEAEEVFRSGKRFEPNRLIFVHHPDGTVYEPIPAKEQQYFGDPAYVDGTLYILLVDFGESLIRIIRCAQDMKQLDALVELPLGEVTDCYNLRISGSPVMLTRSGHEDRFQIIWPEKVDFPLGEREVFLSREAGALLFSEWHEDPDYREEINLREYPTGKLLQKLSGTAISLPDGQNWVLK